MTNTYAVEGKNGDGSSNGKFTLRESSARAAASEVLGTHESREGAALADYLRTYLPHTWAHFDVSKVGRVSVEVLPQFIRFLAFDQTLSVEVHRM